MKKNHLICSCIALLAICFSCKEENTPVDPEPYLPDDPTEIVLNATIALSDSHKDNAALTTHFRWTESDSIGVFMTAGDENVHSEGYALLPGSLAENGREALFTGALHWQQKAMEHRFYAYFPKAPDATDATQIPVTVSAVQEQTGGSYSHLSKYSLLVASPVSVTSPADITDAEQNKRVDMDFISAFSTIEFRFASYKEEDLKINKVTLTSNNGDLAVTDGLLDITVPDFSPGFAAISGGERLSSVSLTITDPLFVPVSEKITVIPDDNTALPADPAIAFPASLTVLPNINAAPKDLAVDEKWTVSLETNKGNFTRTLDRQSIKPGEKYVFEYVVITSDTTGLNIDDPADDTPGTPWNGVVAAPPSDRIDNINKVITIRQPGELAWLAEIVNLERPLELVTDTFFRGYTVLLDANIHLGDHEWTPIGVKGVSSGGKDYIFQGTFDGQGHLISDFKITSPGSNQASVYAGLFGYYGAQEIKNIRVRNAVINLPNLGSAELAYVGGIVGFAGKVYPLNIRNCSFDGTISVNFGAHSFAVGGVCGYTMDGNITACRSSASVTGTSTFSNSARADMGGIAGRVSEAQIKDCEFSGQVDGKGQWNAGGIVGNASSCDVIASKNTGTVDCDGQQAVIGGIAGMGRCNIISCYNTGRINASGGSSIYDNKGVGGIAGSLSMGGLGTAGKILKGCYSTGTVSGSQAFVSRTGNIVGWYEPVASSISFDYNSISNNYYSERARTADSPEGMGEGRITLFAAGAWPSTSMDGWGVGDGSGDNRYWNPEFPSGYGASYPILHWETVR